MISSVFILSTCVIAAAVAHPYGFGAWNVNPGLNLPNPWANFPNANNFPNTNNFPGWFPQPQNNGPWITTEDGIYQIVVKADQYTLNDIIVKIKEGAIYLKGDVIGSNSHSFSYSYSMPSNGNANDATAILTKNGYLEVRVPLTGTVGNIDRTVTITQSDETYTRSD